MDYANASLDELYIELSRDLGGAFGLGDGTPEQGKTVFERAWSQASGAICGSDVVRVMVQDRQDSIADQITLGSLLATQLTVAVGNIVNVTLLVAIAARLGIKALCAGQWGEPGSSPGP